MPVKKNEKEKSQESRILQTFASFQNERDSIIINSIRAFMAVENINSFSAAVRKLVIEQLKIRGYQTGKPLPPELESAMSHYNPNDISGGTANVFYGRSGVSSQQPIGYSGGGHSPDAGDSQNRQLEEDKGVYVKESNLINQREDIGLSNTEVKPTINIVENRISHEEQANTKTIESQDKPKTKSKTEIPKGGLLFALTGQGSKKI